MGNEYVVLSSDFRHHCVQVLVNSETRLEGTIGTTVDGEAKNRQKALTQLREDVLNQVISHHVYVYLIEQ